MPGDDRPALTFFPYLPLANDVAFAEYRMVPTIAFTGPWLSDRFEQLARRFIASFLGPDRQPLRAGAVLVSMEGGCDGTLPSIDERRAIQRAVELAALDANPRWEPDAQAWNIITADNAEMHSWPIDTAAGAVTVTSGFVARTLHGGHRLNDEFIVPAPEELHMPLGTVNLDSGLLDAAYRNFLPTADLVDDRERRRLRDAVGWLSKAWRNTPSVDWPDRVVLLKTGFEALTGESTTHLAAARLQDLFETVVGSDEGAGTELIWSAAEETTRTFVDRRGTTRLCTDLEHWFRSFGEARNAIIHGDANATILEYHEPGSAYNGPYFHIGERLLREATKVTLASRGESLLFEPVVVRAIIARLAELESD